MGGASLSPRAFGEVASVVVDETRTVETVRGLVELDALGPTLMHEHVFVMDPEAFQNYGSF
jgi:hypothetical protein